jgi:hypothetical protein
MRDDKGKETLPPEIRSVRLAGVLFCLLRGERTAEGASPIFSTHVVPRLRRCKHGAPVQGARECRILGFCLETGFAVFGFAARETKQREGTPVQRDRGGRRTVRGPYASCLGQADHFDRRYCNQSLFDCAVEQGHQLVDLLRTIDDRHHHRRCF